MTAIDPRAGDVLLFDDGATIRVDDVEAGRVYFVSWPSGASLGAPTRMDVEVFRAAVEAEAAKRGGVSWGRGDGSAATAEVAP